ncbi:MAG: hypothetical protein R3B89_34860 [Polyangiaceae bacterium]
MFGPTACIPIRLDSSRQVPPAVVERIKAIAEEWWPIVRVRIAHESAIPECVALLRTLNAGAGAVIGSLSVVATAVESLQSCTLLSVELEGSESIEAVRALGELRERNHILDIRRHPTGLTREQLEPAGAWHVREWDEGDPFQPSRGDLVLSENGELVWANDFSPGAFSESSAFAIDGWPLPHMMQLPEPDGLGAVCYQGGSVQGLSGWLAQEEARAALGFYSRDYDKYLVWLNQHVGAEESTPLTPPIFGHPSFGNAGADGETKLDVPERGERVRFVAFCFAVCIAQGQAEQVASFLGLSERPTDFLPEPKSLAGLTGADKKFYRERASSLLARCIELLVESRVPLEKRRAVADVLVILAPSNAKHLADLLAQRHPDAAAHLPKLFKQQSRIRKIRAAKEDPDLGLKFLREALEALARIFPAPPGGAR